MKPAWIVRWTAVIAVSLAAIVVPAASAERVSFPVFGLAFLALFVAILVVIDKPAPRTRYLPPILATLVVGTFPLYRAVALGDRRTGGLFLGITGFMFVLILFGAAQQFVRSRGWVVETPWRRRASVSIMFALVAKSLIERKWPALQYDFITYLLLALMVAVWFWPSRASLRRAALPPPSQRHPA